MKVEINLAELFSATTFGVIAGVLVHASHEKWRGLGRDAYIAHYAKNFDAHFTNPTHTVPAIIACAILALIVFALFKGLAYLYGLISSAMPNKGGAAQE